MRPANDVGDAGCNQDVVVISHSDDDSIPELIDYQNAERGLGSNEYLVPASAPIKKSLGDILKSGEYDQAELDVNCDNWPKSTLQEAIEADWLQNEAPKKLKPTKFSIALLWLKFHVPPFFLWETLTSLAIVCALVATVYTWIYLGSVYAMPENLQRVPIPIFSADIGATTSSNPLVTSTVATVLSKFSCSTHGSLNLGDCLVQRTVKNYGALSWLNLNNQTTYSLQTRRDFINFVQANSSPVALFFGTDLSNNLTTFVSPTGSPTLLSPNGLYVEVLQNGALGTLASGLMYELLRTVQAETSYDFGQTVSAIGQNASLSATYNRINKQLLFLPLSLKLTVISPALYDGEMYAALAVPILIWMSTFVIGRIVVRYVAANQLLELLPILYMQRDASAMPASIRAYVDRRLGGIRKYDSTALDLSNTSFKIVASAGLLLTASAVLVSLTYFVPIVALSQNLSSGELAELYGFLLYFSIACICVHLLLLALFTRTLAGLISALLALLQVVSSQSLTVYQAQSPFYQIGKGLPVAYAVAQIKRIMYGYEAETIANVYLVIFGWLGGSILAVIILATFSKFLYFRPTLLANGPEYERKNATVYPRELGEDDRRVLTRFKRGWDVLVESLKLVSLDNLIYPVPI